ncbi:MAG: type II toxin-antitoxin system RelE/ParE family toxin [Candidatus Sericytochromatia bacterium]
MPYRLTRAADDDAFDIVRSAAKFSPRLARVVDAELNELLERIGETPGIGAKKPHITPHPYRFKLFRDYYWIVYQDAPKGEMVSIVRILSVHEDLLASLLK